MIKIICIFFLMFSSVLNAAELYFIDAHSQYEKAITGEEIIEQMNKAGVKQAIISSRRGRSAFEAVELAATFPEKIIPSIRIKSRHYQQNTNKFYKKLKKQLKSEGFMAMSEVHMFHAQKGSKADEVRVHADDNRIHETLTAAIDNEWPYVVHIEFASLTTSEAAEFMKELEMLLVDHPEHPLH